MTVAAEKLPLLPQPASDPAAIAANTAPTALRHVDDGSDAANRRISILVLDKRAATSITNQSVQTWSEAPPKIASPAGTNVPEESAVVIPNMALESLNDALNAP